MNRTIQLFELCYFHDYVEQGHLYTTAAFTCRHYPPLGDEDRDFVYYWYYHKTKAFHLLRVRTCPLCSKLTRTLVLLGNDYQVRTYIDPQE